MRKFISYLITIFIVCILTTTSFILAGVLYLQDSFVGSYQSALPIKYKALVSTDDPKIIIISGSSSVFGLDQTLLETETNYKVVNLGLQASIGPRFICEIAKANINPGDIILFGYEYTWWENWKNFDSVRADLIMSGIGSNYEIYRYVPFEKLPEFIGYLPTFIEEKKRHYKKEFSGIYSLESFDLITGNMIADRSTAEYKYDISHGVVDFSALLTIDEECIDYFVDYKNYVQMCGASIYFISPPFVKNSVLNADLADEYRKNVEKKTEIQYISNPTDYFFPEEYMYDGYCHCNNVGAVERTRLLVNDLRCAGLIDKR